MFVSALVPQVAGSFESVVLAPARPRRKWPPCFGVAAYAVETNSRSAAATVRPAEIANPMKSRREILRLRASASSVTRSMAPAPYLARAIVLCGSSGARPAVWRGPLAPTRSGAAGSRPGASRGAFLAPPSACAGAFLPLGQPATIGQGANSRDTGGEAGGGWPAHVPGAQEGVHEQRLMPHGSGHSSRAQPFGISEAVVTHRVPLGGHEERRRQAAIVGLQQRIGELAGVAGIVGGPDIDR